VLPAVVALLLHQRVAVVTEFPDCPDVLGEGARE
jgi:hypothetical protein